MSTIYIVEALGTGLYKIGVLGRFESFKGKSKVSNENRIFTWPKSKFKSLKPKAQEIQAQNDKLYADTWQEVKVLAEAELKSSYDVKDKGLIQ